MLHHIEIAIARIDRDRDGIANAAREVLALGLGLVKLACVEAPDARPFLELGAGIGAWHLELAVGALAGVGLGSNVDVERTIASDRERLRAVAALGQSRDHLFGCACRGERAGWKLVAE